MNQTIGIDAIAFAVPEGYLDLRDLAEARGVPAAKYVDGLGVEQMAVARPEEDPVALAANAARRLFEKGDIDTSRIGMCIVGTETGVDHSKPVAAWLHGLLGLPSNCRVFETKHACFGGTAGLLTAVDWIASGSARGRSALIVCTDIARYSLETAGEPTQGAGAIAFLISESPRLLALEVGVTGSYARDVYDFWRPLYSKDAIVDGQYSVTCYLDALEGAYRAWRAASAEAGLDGETPTRRCYHVPYGKMARKAHRHIGTIEGRTDAEADASFTAEVAPSLRLPSQVGNVYTGSLYLALASLLHAEAGTLEGQRISLFSYGSGCAAEYFAGRVVPGAGDFARALEIAGPLEGRHRYTIAEYTAIRRGDSDVDRAPVGAPPAVTEGVAGVAFLGVDRDRRVYRQ